MTQLAVADQHAVWEHAQSALLWLQVDPYGLGGIWLKAGHGPMRDAWLSSLHRPDAGFSSVCKVPTHSDAQRLLGGVDLTAALHQGQWQTQPGLLAQAASGVLLLPMAERQTGHTLALVAQGQTQHRYGVVALDESSDDEASLPLALQDRLGLWLDMRELPYDAQAQVWRALSASELRHTRERLKRLVPAAEHCHSLCAAATALGVHSLRAMGIALRLACVVAALDEREALTEQDLQQAIQSVLLPRATQWPAPPASQDEAPPPDDLNDPSADTAQAHAPEQPEDAPVATPPEEPHAQTASAAPTAPPEDVLLAAAMAQLPPHLLAKLAMGAGGKPRAMTMGTSGHTQQGQHRGRPLAPRKGSPHSGARLHVLATLRAAAPHQKWRTHLGQTPLALCSEDFHVHRYAQKTATCVMVLIDASGSAALERLAQTKGAVELLLHQSYARRDSVCVMSFRGTRAETVLPPTRALVRAKKALAALPGGGGTPMATALQHAHVQAQQLMRQGMTPLLVVLSDGRANVTLAGVGGRAQAHEESLQCAQRLASLGLSSLWIDTGLQPNGLALPLSQHLQALYLHMPHVESSQLATAMQSLQHANGLGMATH